MAEMVARRLAVSIETADLAPRRSRGEPSPELVHAVQAGYHALWLGVPIDRVPAAYRAVLEEDVEEVARRWGRSRSLLLEPR
jgi:hypothetical protein